jgi:hypothetical protein
MIVDCHTHIHLGADDLEVSEHCAAAETVDTSIVLATPEEPSEQMNKKMA